MKKLTLLAVLVPMLAAAAPPAAGHPAPEAERGARAEHLQKRMRLARALGLAEALDLDDAAVLRVRDALARYDEKRAPLRDQARAAIRIVRDAAHGDQAAAGQVDAAIQRARDARSKLQALDAQLVDEIAKGLTPERKARAALFLATFHHGGHRFAGSRGRGMGGCGPGGHMGGPGMGGPGMHRPHLQGMADPGQEPGEPQAVTLGDAGEDELEGEF